MNIKFFLAVSAVILLGINSVGQTAVDVNSCSWMSVNTVVDANGLPMTTYEVGNGPDGSYRFYSVASDSLLVMEGSLLAGKKQGVWRFYSGGKLTQTVSYVESVKSGPFESYYENGNIRLKAFYSDDKLNGDYILYDSSGNEELHLNMVNDVPANDK